MKQFGPSFAHLATPEKPAYITHVCSAFLEPQSTSKSEPNCFINFCQAVLVPFGVRERSENHFRFIGIDSAKALSLRLHDGDQVARLKPFNGATRFGIVGVALCGIPIDHPAGDVQRRFFKGKTRVIEKPRQASQKRHRCCARAEFFSQSSL